MAPNSRKINSRPAPDRRAATTTLFRSSRPLGCLAGLLLAAHVLLPARAGGAAETDNAIFATAWTNIEATGARLVFSTSVPLRAQIVVRQGTREVQRLTEAEDSLIHGVAIAGLLAGQTYQVEIEAKTTDGAVLRTAAPVLTPAAPVDHFDKFEGKTLFGIGHAPDADPLRQLGPGLVRYSMTWDTLQPRPGEFDPARIRQMVSEVRAIKAAGAEPLVLICFSTPWEKVHTNRQMTWRHPAFGPPDELADWQNYVRLVMTNLKGLAHFYEVWNEPDAGYLADGKPVEQDTAKAASTGTIFQHNDPYWLGDRYVPLVTAARQVADEVDPNISLLAGSWNHDYHGTRAELTFGRGMQHALQQYSIHNYVGAPHSYALWENWTNLSLTTADRVFQKYRAPLPIAVTEWGIQTYDQRPEKSGFSSRHDGQLFLVKSAFYYLGLERVSMLVLHQLGYNDPWSLVQKDGAGHYTYEPAFATYHWICATFNARKYHRLPITAIDKEVRAYAIQLPEEGVAYVALWQDKLDEKTQQVVPLPARPEQIQLDGLEDGIFQWNGLDLSGNLVPRGTVHVNHGLSWMENIPEAGAGAESEVVLYRLTRVG